MKIELTILGDPKAQKRHRSFRRGEHIRNYDPSSTEKRDFLSIVQSKAPERPFDEPLAVMLYFDMPRPKGHYGTGRNAGVLKASAPKEHTKKPDIDNLVKFVLDALHGVYWRDDSIITSIWAKKSYSEKPKTIVVIDKALREQIETKG